MTSPTDTEQLLLELLNRARLDPQGEYDALIADTATQTGVTDDITGAIQYFDVDLAVFATQLSTASAVAPLAWNDDLAAAAEGHSEAMITADVQSHQVAGELDLGDRIAAEGYAFTAVSENVYAYAYDGLYAHAGFYIDWGDTATGIQDPAGHRNAMLSSTMTEVGMSALDQTDDSLSVGPLVVTQNFGTRAGYSAQLVGVVIDDLDSDAFYDIGEGLDDIEIVATSGDATYTTTTWASGGYQMALPSGSYDVAFYDSTGTLIDNGAVTIGTDNVKLDGIAGMATGTLFAGTDAGDTETGSDADDTLSGAGGNDGLYGAGGNDAIDGGNGHDDMGGSTGQDTITGGAGNDSIGGGAGDDRLYGEADNDFLGGGADNDLVKGGAGADVVNGGAGDDSLYGGTGDDTLGGAFGADTLDGGDDADDLGGGTGGDSILGGGGDDTVGGGAGNDTILGEGGDDFLAGGGRHDVLRGGGGNDTLNGGDGNDTLSGGADADLFKFNFATATSYGTDEIDDFELGVDQILMHGVAGGLAGLGITGTTGGVQITYDGHVVTVLGDGLSSASFSTDHITLI